MEQTKEQQGEYRYLTGREIGDAITVFRKAAQMKQITLAHYAGITERTIQRAERGEKISDENLRSIARALRLEDGAFVGARYIPTEDEAVENAIEALEGRKLIAASHFATLKDAAAVLGTHGSLIDDHFVKDDAAEDAATFKDLLRDWNDVYSDLYSEGEKVDACRSLLTAAQALEAKGYVIRYGVHTTDDNYTMVTMLFARKEDEELCEVKQLLVPARFTELAKDSLYSFDD